MRQDLLALTLDDLATLSNRGIVKRAQKELEKFTFELAEGEDGAVTVRWSDEVECHLPPHKTLGESHCSCAATELCRHLVRSVLAYQQLKAGEAAPEPRREAWNPGQIPDETLAASFRAAALTQLRQQFEAGHVVELVGSSKPTAHFHTLALTVRFLVPGDIRYTHCDCDEAAPCKHVPLAIWAFRQLGPDQQSGLITTGPNLWPVPEPLLAELDRSLAELAEVGLAGATQPLVDRFRRLEARCRAEGLFWPAEILAELEQEYSRYTNHDARFSATRLAELIGELCLRSQAIRNDTGQAPQLFIRGNKQDRETKVGTARLVGLGCGVEIVRGSVTLSAYLQDIDTGVVVAVRRDFADPAEGEAPPFSELAGRALLKGISLRALGAQQLLIKGGKRLASYQFVPGRANVAANPQAYQWETLRAPLLAEDFAEIRARLRVQPPLCLRPRRIAENFYICPISQVEAAYFDPAGQEVHALLRDAAGDHALLSHPYTGRGQAGVEKLLSWLGQQPEALRFVAGQVSLGGPGGGLLYKPIALIFQNGAGRVMLQPWVDGNSGPAPVSPPAAFRARLASPQPVTAYPHQLLEALGELFLNGLHRADFQTARFWAETERQGAALGFVRLLEPVARLVALLHQKSASLTWEPQPAAEAALELAILTRLAQEELL